MNEGEKIMKTPPFNLFQPKTIEEAIEISSNL